MRAPRASQTETRKVVIVTGIDYPGHKWKETAPVLAEALRKDARLKVDVVETPAFLASPKLNDYNTVVLHFMNWESPDPGEQARQNLAQFVSNGGGMVLVHFACGAFQGWPEFEKLAGRVYDPKLRPHDPYGSFQVVRTSVDHPITRGMQPFETTDELYTCLAGNTPIEIIATAKSKVDGKDYPMGFVLNYGKGRVFHSVLGHDAQAIANPPVAELFRRATAWSAGLTPASESATAKPKKIAFLAGKPSHGEGIHGWEKDAEFVKQCLLHADEHRAHADRRLHGRLAQGCRSAGRCRCDHLLRGWSRPSPAQRARPGRQDSRIGQTRQGTGVPSLFHRPARGIAGGPAPMGGRLLPGGPLAEPRQYRESDAGRERPSDQPGLPRLRRGG